MRSIFWYGMNWRQDSSNITHLTEESEEQDEAPSSDTSGKQKFLNHILNSNLRKSSILLMRARLRFFSSHICCGWNFSSLMDVVMCFCYDGCINGYDNGCCDGCCDGLLLY